MRIGLDLRMVKGGSGIDRYISELSHAILKQDKTNQYVLFFKDTNQTADYIQYGQKIIVTGIGHYTYAEQLKLPGILNQEHLDIIHFPHFNVPLLYRKPFIVTIHDLTHTLMPGKNRFRSYKRLAYNLIIRHAVKSSNKIIAVSNSTKQQIVQYFKIPADKVEVVYEAANANYKMINKDDAFAHVSNRFGIKKPYILYVGVWRRYKNLVNLAKVFDRLKEKHDYELVLVGEEDPFYPEIKSQITAIRNQNSVKILGRVNEEDLPYLYNAADLFVLPSIAEGFGLTPLEAANCGIPVVCSDIPTLREVMGNGAEFFDPKNLDNMEEVINSVLTNRQKAEDLANRALSRTKHFSWTKAAADTINIYSHS